MAAKKFFAGYDFPMVTTAIYNFWLYELCVVYIVSATCVPPLCLYSFAQVCIPLPTLCTRLYSFVHYLHMSVFFCPPFAHVCIPLPTLCTCLCSFVMLVKPKMWHVPHCTRAWTWGYGSSVLSCPSLQRS